MMDDDSGGGGWILCDLWRCKKAFSFVVMDDDGFGFFVDNSMHKVCAPNRCNDASDHQRHFFRFKQYQS